MHVCVSMCMCVCVCVCVCMCVEPLSHALTMLHCPLDRYSNLCKDSFFPFVSSIPFLRRFCCSPFSLSPVWIPLVRPLSSHPPPPLFSSSSSSSPSSSRPVLSDCVHLLLFLSLCHSSTLLYLRLLPPPPTVVAYWSPFLPPTLLRSLCLFVVTLPYPCIHLTLSFSALFHVLPLLVRLTPQVVKSEKKQKKKKVHWFLQPLSHLLSLPCIPFSPSSGLK